jgi:hypothetical protein
MGQSALCGRDSTPCSRRGAPGAWSDQHTAAQLASGAPSARTLRGRSQAQTAGEAFCIFLVWPRLCTAACNFCRMLY